MIELSKWVVGALCVVALACGGGDSAEGEEHSSGGEHEGPHEHHGEHHGEHHEHGEHHHAHDLPPALSALHDAFAPLWHGDRAAATVCPEAANLQTLAGEAAAEHEEHPDEGEALNAAAEAFIQQCEATPDGGPEYDAAFDRFHTAMHGLMHDSADHE